MLKVFSYLLKNQIRKRVFLTFWTDCRYRHFEHSFTVYSRYSKISPGRQFKAEQMASKVE